MNLDIAMQTFKEESRELLAEMESILLQVEASEIDAEQVNALFRAMHTIKGSAGLFGLDAIVHFSHEAENVVDMVRSGERPYDDELSGLLLRCHDHVKAMLGQLDDAAALADMAEPPLFAELQAWQGASLAVVAPPEPVGEVQSGVPAASLAPDWALSLRFGDDVLRNGMDPSAFLRYLAVQGRILQIRLISSRLPSAEAFDPETNYLRFELCYRFDGPEQSLHDTFEFVQDGSQIVILPLEELAGQFERLLQYGDQGEQQQVIAAWQQMGIATGHESTELAVPEAIAPVVEASSGNSEKSPAEPRQGKSVESKFIKVEAGKLDTLINLVGELVIAGAAANLLARRSGQSALVESTVAIAGLVEQIRAGTLSMRMVQIGETFGRFPRVVRDISRELGKSISLQVSGADTELDKSMVDKLSDPLMHLVRNAIDHGIESAGKRLAAGKPETGRIWLNAYHEAGSVVIEVADDGGGLNREAILAKAIANGLVSEDSLLNDRDIYRLVFEAGFSTAEQVTSISGRGVGMDVVRKAIEQMRGSIEIDVEPGEGTTFRIHLPLTLAIIDGFQVGIGSATFIIPLDAVIECIELPAAAHPGQAHNCLNLRGEALPLLDLNRFLELDFPPGKRQNVVVVRYGERKAGLLVDELHGEFQTVIKPLGALFRKLRAISGSTILGSGEVALILDVPALIRHAVEQENAISRALPGLGVSRNES